MLVSDVDIMEVPDDTLAALSRKPHGWVLAHLSAETLFDVEAIGLLLVIGYQAVQDELERRKRMIDQQIAGTVDTTSEAVVTEADLDAMFGPVLHFGVDVAVDSMEDLVVIDEEFGPEMLKPFMDPSPSTPTPEPAALDPNDFDLVYKAPKVDPVFEEPF